MSPGCPTPDGYYINANDTEDYDPVTEVPFDAFRFKEQDEVIFSLLVRVCKGRTSTLCSFRVSDVTCASARAAPARCAHSG